MKHTALILTLAATSALAQAPAPKPAPRINVRPAPAAPGVPAPAQQQLQPDILDLTPLMEEYNEDGLFVQKLCFRSPKTRVLVAIPGGWDLDISKGTPVFHLKADKKTIVTIAGSKVPLLPLDTEDARKSFRETLLSTAPADAERATISAESESPFPINGWMSYQFTMAYAQFGQRYQKQVVLVRLSPFQEIQLIADAPEKNFPIAANAIGSILNSWHREPLKLAAKPAPPKPEIGE